MSSADHAHPVVSIRLYVTVFVALLVFTGITVWVADHDYGMLNTPIALGIAVTKASLVVLFFMGVRHNTPLTKVVVVAGFFWLFILFGIGMSDYLTRDLVGMGR
jgi:cytochrome c oxidase subunit 4